MPPFLEAPALIVPWPRLCKSILNIGLNSCSGSQSVHFAHSTARGSRLLLSGMTKGRVTLPNWMNFRKGSKGHMTPNPHPSEWSLFLEIVCMHSILSGHHTSSHICNHIYHKKMQHNFPKMMGGGRRPFGIFPKIHPIW